MNRQGFAVVVAWTLAAVAGMHVVAAAPHDIVPIAFQDDVYYRQGDEFLVRNDSPASTFVNDGSSAALANPSCGCAAFPCSTAAACGNAVTCGDPCCGLACDCGAACVGASELSLASLIGLPANSPWQFGGWTEAVYANNTTPLARAYNDGLSFDDVPDHLHLGQQWFYLGRTVDGSRGFDLGGRLDLVYGTDAQKTQAFGNPGSADPAAPGPFNRGFGTFDASLDHGEYGWAIPQAYAEIAAGDLAVKVGHFFTPLGYEVIPVTGNFFRSHSYTMFNSEPFTHTGALGSYALGDLTLYGGWALGWDTGFDQLNSGNIAIGGFAYALAESVTFTYLNTYGNFGWRDGGGDDSYSHSCVLVASLTDRLKYIAQSDLVDTNNAGVSEYDTIGLSQYLIYWWNDIVGLGGRVEWWKADGVSYYEATSGLNFKVLDNLVIRPEYRKDWSPTDAAFVDEETFLVDAYVTY